MKRLLLVTLLVVLVTGGLLFAAGAKEKEREIAVVPQQLGNVVFLPAEEGMKDAGRDFGVKVLWEAPPKAEAQLQVEVMEGLIERGVAGIAISCNHPDALQGVINRAVAAGIVVTTFDADSPLSDRAFFAGTNNYQAGYISGQEMIRLYKDNPKPRIRVALLEGIPGAFDIESRKRGFKDAIAGTNIEVVYEGPCDDDVDKSVIIVEDYTRANPDIDAWFMAGGWPYIVQPGAMPEYTKWKQADPVNRKVVTLDVFPSSEAFFDLGLIDSAIDQDFYAMGYLSVENILNILDGKPVQGLQDIENELDDGSTIMVPSIDTGTKIVLLENYKDYF
ncbi:MAG: sugar ABC transporter substrate-binding protein [Spirochaetales bacterium]|jgi:ribose transport system substrate-binding protein|nr:sugar ABC transporter substrate-binding protein [Spirochaetales bacterium]